MTKIPIQLQNPDFRFVLLGKYNLWGRYEQKNGKNVLVETHEFNPIEYEKLDKEKIWKPLGKTPYQNEWQKKQILYNSDELINHDNNIGIIGGYGKLRILDIDDIELGEKLEKELDTFTIKTGSGGKHFYFLSDHDVNCVLIDKKGEFRANNYQVVTIPSRHPNGNPYILYIDKPIREISKEEIQTILKNYIKNNINNIKTTETLSKNEIKKQDTSRSALEYRKIIALIKKGKTKEEIYDEMNAYSKWISSPEQYKEHTFNKAKTYIELQKIEKHTQTEEELRELFMAIGQAKKFISKQPIYYERKGQFWAWDYNNYCWTEKDETDILNLVRKVSYLDTITSKHKNEILEAIKQVGRDNKPEDIKPSWVQFKDKIYDIEDNSILQTTPKYFIVNPINWKIGETEETPIIDKLINSWVLPEDIPKLYEFFAFCIVPKYFIHSFIFLYGPPGTGKSTFVNLLIKFIGQHNCVATSIDRINKNSRFETKNWYKKLLITQSEVSNVDDLKNSAIINQATGEDPIAAEIKGGENFSFINYGKFIYPTNKFLKVDEDDGFGRRVRTVKFLNRFEKEKDVLEKIPDSEFENLAKKCLRIAHELWIKRNFTGDVNISERMKKYQEISKTPLELFINQHCDISDFNAKTLFDEFYAKYIKITQRDDSKIKISKELKKLGFEINLENWKKDISQQTLKNDNMSKFNDNFVNWISGRRISGITLK